MVVIYVDDGLVAASSVGAIDNFLLLLSKRFELTSKQADYFLGLQIDYDVNSSSLKIHQSAYTQSLLKRFEMQD